MYGVYQWVDSLKDNNILRIADWDKYAASQLSWHLFEFHFKNRKTFLYVLIVVHNSLFWSTIVSTLKWPKSYGHLQGFVQQHLFVEIIVLTWSNFIF